MMPSWNHPIICGTTKRPLSVAENSNPGAQSSLVHPQVAGLRQRWRKQQGAVDFQLQDCEIVVTDARSVHPAVALKDGSADNTPANLFVSELMILANEAVGKFGERHRILNLHSHSWSVNGSAAGGSFQSVNPSIHADSIMKDFERRMVEGRDWPID